MPLQVRYFIRFQVGANLCVHLDCEIIFLNIYRMILEVLLQLQHEIYRELVK
jgi:hypothetical protein